MKEREKKAGGREKILQRLKNPMPGIVRKE